MRTIKCDLCKKEIEKQPITAGFGFFPSAELCEECGLPIINFLKKHKFIKEDKTKIKEN